MKFKKKHPYLFWQCIGLLILAIDCVYVLSNLENEHVSYLFIVLSGMVAFAIITLSPFVIKTCKKQRDSAEVELSYQYKYIEEWYVMKPHGWNKAGAVIISMLFLFVGGTMVLTFIGFPWFFLSFLLLYIDIAIYRLWQKHVRRSFYKVPDGAKHCELVRVKDAAFLDVLYTHTALAYFFKPGNEALNFLYNRFNNETLNRKHLLMNPKLKIYAVNSKLLNDKYGFAGYRFNMPGGKYLLCILPEELNPEVAGVHSIAERDCDIGCLFPDYVNNCPEKGDLKG